MNAAARSRGRTQQQPTTPLFLPVKLLLPAHTQVCSTTRKCTSLCYLTIFSLSILNDGDNLDASLVNVRIFPGNAVQSRATSASMFSLFATEREHVGNNVCALLWPDDARLGAATTTSTLHTSSSVTRWEEEGEGEREEAGRRRRRSAEASVSLSLLEVHTLASPHRRSLMPVEPPSEAAEGSTLQV